MNLIINNLNFSKVFKYTTFSLGLTKQRVTVLQYLYKLGVIAYFKITGGSILVKLMYINGQLLYKTFKLIRNKMLQFCLSYKSIQAYNKHYQSVLIVSTSRGLLTNYDNRGYKVGGYLKVICFN